MCSKHQMARAMLPPSLLEGRGFAVLSVPLLLLQMVKEQLKQKVAKGTVIWGWSVCPQQAWAQMSNAFWHELPPRSRHVCEPLHRWTHFQSLILPPIPLIQGATLPAWTSISRKTRPQISEERDTLPPIFCLWRLYLTLSPGNMHWKVSWLLLMRGKCFDYIGNFPKIKDSKRFY